MRNYFRYISVILLFMGASMVVCASSESHDTAVEEELNIKTLILEHLGDTYDWHLTTVGEKHISIPLPIILYSKTSGFHVFLSSKFHHGHEAHNGFYIASEGNYKGKKIGRAHV